MLSIVPISMIDWPGMVSTVIFFGDCNMKCKHCHNFTELNRPGTRLNKIEVKKEIKDSRMFTDAVVFGGGEPTLNLKDLLDVARYAKILGMKIGVHSNGLDTGAIHYLVNRGIVDKFFIDYKLPTTVDQFRSNSILGVEDYKSLDLSIGYIVKDGIDLEIRTTVFDDVHTAEDIHEIARTVSQKFGRSITYVLQSGRINEKPVITNEELEGLRRLCGEYLDNVIVRTQSGER